MQLPWIGYRIFKWLLLVVSVLLLLLFLYAWRTYPDISSVEALVDADAAVEDKLAAVEALRSSWLTSVKDLGQMFVLTPIFPLIGAVVGYIFGVSRQLSTAEQATPVEQQTTTPATSVDPTSGPPAGPTAPPGP